jgi:hypothetical protein
MSAVVLTRIVPTTIDTVPVFPTNAVVIAEEPTQDYRWETIELPDSWPLDTYYIELWDARNEPIPGHTATKLISHTIDISDIDATLTPSVRAVIFQPPNTPAPPADYAIYFHYETFPNYRLLVLVSGAALGLVTLLVWSLRQKRQLVKLPKAITGLLRGHFTTPYLAVICTVLFAGVFGAILGSFIGGIQIVYVLVKLPFLMGAALLISFTTLLVLSWLTGVKASLKEIWTVALNLLAITALGLCSFSTILGFYILYPLEHDQVLIATMLFFIAAGVLALVSLYRWQRKLLLPVVWIAVYGMVFLQLGWMLRPWVGVIDPVHETVPIARANSGNVFQALTNLIN